MTLLERWEMYTGGLIKLLPRTQNDVRRALAIAQAVEELNPPLLPNTNLTAAIAQAMQIEAIMRRADELLKEKK